MLERRERTSGTSFFGCCRFPECRGTRPIAGLADKADPKPVELGTGGRYARTFPDVVELLMARRLGRSLSRKEGCLVQGLALVGLLFAIYLFAVSGAFMWLVTTFAEWYASQVTLPGAPTPSP